jgi:hypothetical protein
MKHPTEPSTRNAASAAPYLPHDLISLHDTHAVRLDPGAKRPRSWRHKDVKTVRRAIRAWLDHQGLPTDQGYPVPLYWLHDWLAYGPVIGRRTPRPGAAWDAHTVMVSALNQPHSGLRVVTQRRMQRAS